MNEFSRGACLAASIGALALVAGGAPAADKSAKARAAVLDGVAQCRSLTDDAARLACFDKAVGALDAAEQRGDVVVLDKAQVHEAKRQSFGLNINLGPLFDHGTKAEAVDQLDTTLASATQDLRDNWIITTAEGQVWRQIDSGPLFRDPKPGQKVVIKKGLAGSFSLKIGDDRAMRVHRDN